MYEDDDVVAPQTRESMQRLRERYPQLTDVIERALEQGEDSQAWRDAELAICQA